MKFALFGNTHQSKKSENIEMLFQAMHQWKDHYSIDGDFYEYLRREIDLPFDPEEIIQGNDFTADMVISFGGDGTFLRAASRVANKRIPMLGINTGRLGFLATVSPYEVEKAWALLHEGRFLIEERGLIQVIAQGSSLESYPYALNEVAVMKHDSSSMITIETTLNNENVITYQADGLIVAAPSGSTGYSLSVGGPIIAPDAHVFVLTPIAPHSLNARPVVLNDSICIKLNVASRSHHFLVAIDGRNESCPEGTQLTLQKAPYSQLIVRLDGKNFFQNLRDKMMWGVDTRI